MQWPPTHLLRETNQDSRHCGHKSNSQLTMSPYQVLIWKKGPFLLNGPFFQRSTKLPTQHYYFWLVFILWSPETTYFAHDSGCKVLWWVCLSVCVTLCPTDISGTTRASFTKFLCMLAMFVAQSSSSMLTIGSIAYQRKGGDGSAQHRRSVMYDCLVLFRVVPGYAYCC